MAATKSQSIPISTLLRNQSGSIRRFNKIPEEAEAVQFQGWQNAPEIFTWIEGIFFVPQGYEHKMRVTDEYDAVSGTIRNDAPEYLVFKGDKEYRLDIETWIVRTAKGDLYFYNPEQFASIYQERVQ